LQRPDEIFDAVVYPHPFVHAKPDWETLKFFLENKGRAILYGLTPQFLVDGTNVTAEWERVQRAENWRHIEDETEAPQQVADWLENVGMRDEG
jgi:hypothetical protein